MASFKDANGQVVSKGDLVMLHYRRFPHRNPETSVFYEVSSTNTLTHYPISEDGLTLAKYENNEYDLGQSGVFRIEPFTITKIKSSNVIKIEQSALSPAERVLYAGIRSRIL